MVFVMLLPCFLLFPIGLAMGLKRIPPNHSVGYRTARTLSDETIWYQVNANVGWTFAVLSVVSAGLIWWIFRQDMDVSAQCLLALIPILVTTVIAVVVGSLS